MGVYGSNINQDIIGAAERDFAPQVGQHKSSLGKEDFLKLLSAQLGHQDPLNPMEDKEFTAQLAQFSSLEQLTNISTGITDLNTKQHDAEMYTAVGFVGKEVVADGNEVSKINDYCSTLYYELDEPVENLHINVFDKDNNLIRTVNTGQLGKGFYEYTWDGKNYAGKAADNGKFTITMAAENTEGSPVLIDTQVSGKVMGVKNIDNVHHLRLQDGRTIPFSMVDEVVDTASVQQPQQPDENPDDQPDDQPDDES